MASKQALRHNEGKLRYDLIPWEVEKLLAQVYTDSTKKYPENDWRKGMDWNHCLAAIRRHLALWQAGEKTSPDTGTHHLGSIIWNCASLYYYELYGLGKDTVHTHANAE